MGIFSKIFKGHQPETYHIDPDKYENLDSADGSAEQAGTSSQFEASEPAVPESPDFTTRAEENIETVQPLAATQGEQPEATPERQSFQEILALGAQRAEEARARRAESRAKMVENAKGIWNRAKSGVKSAASASRTAVEVGKAAYYAKGELAAGAGAAAKEFGASKKEQAAQALEAGYNSLAEKGNAAYASLNSKIDQAHASYQNFLAERAQNKENARMAQLVEQRTKHFNLFMEYNKQIREKQAAQEQPVAANEFSSQAA